MNRCTEVRTSRRGGAAARRGAARAVNTSTGRRGLDLGQVRVGGRAGRRGTSARPRSRSAMSCSPRRSSGPGHAGPPRRRSSPSSVTSRSSTCWSMVSSTSSRTGGPKRRRSSPFSSAASRFSASSSSTSRSSLRVTRKVWTATHLHAGEQRLEVLGDDVLERHEPLLADGDEPVEDRRHLDPGEVLLAGLRVAHQHGEVERQPGDVGERVRGVDRERGQDREDPLLEQLLAAASAPRGRGRPSARSSMPSSAQRRARSRRGTARRAAASASAVVAQICSSTSRGSSPRAAVRRPRRRSGA